MRARMVIVLTLVCTVILGGGWAQSAAATQAPRSVAAPAAYNCNNVTDGTSVADCQALVALYTSTNGSGWTQHTDWTGSSTPCSWSGVLCDAGRVTGLELWSSNLTGPIPTDVGTLTQLAILDLTDNNLSQSIPSALGSLSQLVTMRLGSNLLSGTIPPGLGNLANLVQLDLSYNNLSGSIPPALGGPASPANHLETLNLYSNLTLSGQIPVELGHLISLTTLSLGGNQLTGSIPPVLGSLPNLQTLQLDNNQLSGMVPAELGNLINGQPNSLSGLYLNNNALTRNLPQNLRNDVLAAFEFNATSLCEPPDQAPPPGGFQDWLNLIDPPPSNPLRTNVLCAPKGSVVAISRSTSPTTNDIVLTWTDQSPNTGYEVHRSSTAPYFTPDGTNILGSVLPQPTHTATDTGAFSAASNYYYVVQFKFQDAFNGTPVNNLSLDSNRTGKFSFSLTRGS